MHAGFLEVPDWFSTENEGGGIAAADLNGDGTQDLVVFMIDNPPARTAAFTGSAGHWTPTATSPAAGRGGPTSRTGSPGRTRAAASPSLTSTGTARTTWSYS